MHVRARWMSVVLLLAAAMSGCASTTVGAWQDILAGCADAVDDPGTGMVYVGPSRGVGVGALWRTVDGTLELVAPAPVELPPAAVEVVGAGVCDRHGVALVNPELPSELVLSRLGERRELDAALDRATRVEIAVGEWRDVRLVRGPFEQWLASLPPDHPYLEALRGDGVEVADRAIEVDGMRSTLRLEGGRAAEVISSFGATISSSALFDAAAVLELELSDWDTLEMLAPETLVIAVASIPRGVEAAQTTETLPFSFATEEGYVFDGLMHVPPADRRNGYGVLLLGGGMANDLDWTVPGHLEIDGTQRQLTISGEPHADAKLLADALAARGFVVGRWSTIRRDDPSGARWPYAVTTYPPARTVLHARTALSAFRAPRLFDDDRTILLGYSMGAHRACIMADEYPGIAALVLLAPAQLTRTGPDDRGQNTQRSTALVLLASIDEDGDGSASRDELERWRRDGTATELIDEPFDTLDFDGDGAVRPWELSAAIARRARATMTLPGDLPVDGHGLPWGEDVLVRRRVPTLVLYGSLDDAQGQHAPIIADLVAQQGLDHVTVQVVPEIGHAMGAEVDGRIGPIAAEVLTRIATWLDGATRSDQAEVAVGGRRASPGG